MNNIKRGGWTTIIQKRLEFHFDRQCTSLSSRSILRISCCIKGRCRISWLAKEGVRIHWSILVTGFNIIMILFSKRHVSCHTFPSMRKKTREKTTMLFFAWSCALGRWVCSRWSKSPPVLRCQIFGPTNNSCDFSQRHPIDVAPPNSCWVTTV